MFVCAINILSSQRQHATRDQNLFLLQGALNNMSDTLILNTVLI